MYDDLLGTMCVGGLGVLQGVAFGCMDTPSEKTTKRIACYVFSNCCVFPPSDTWTACVANVRLCRLCVVALAAHAILHQIVNGPSFAVAI